MEYGPYQSHVECLGHHKEENTLYVSSHLKTKLNLAKHKQINLNINESICTVSIILGVFLAGFSSDSEPLGPRTKLYEIMSDTGRKFGFQTIFFGYQHIDRDEKKIYAYHFEDSSWKQSHHAIPTVIYNRLPNRKIEHHPEIINAKQLLESQATLFNPSFFNKWEIHEKLMKNPDCSYLLPKTILHPSEQKISILLEEHGLYIKPIHGSRGEGIVKCAKLKNNEYESHYYVHDKPQINRYTSLNAMIKQHFPNGLQRYVAQEEVPLLKKGKSAIDFRVHANKNHKNSWEVTLICAKFAGKGSLTTHVQRGGSIHVLSELFSKEQASRIKNKLTNTAIFLSNKLEKSFKQPIGEIGYDFGIDEEGKIWLFEANSKPGFSVFNHPRINLQADEVLSYLFKYAFYLYNLRLNKLE